MTLIERATKSANSVADQTVSTVSQIGTAVAEGVVVTTRDIRAGMREGHIRPRTAVVAAAVGLIAVVEWPILLAAGGVALLASKLKKRSPEPETEGATVIETIDIETETPE
ncbi:hypothetical protein BN1232_04286 [Mycobacterium lentiflavum]|uniref:Transmembrane protein n=1 Tax=Mycobacterium lentiflavum TaxID=141349 RepID=A0A0E4H0A7_MYCLN|nr:hypothetical protein [Mycobacterium lentiflavum]MEE3065646.1 hypothetical protein [Actinomycetota bacterium]ULP41082.1 hypothetical protein MJO58_19580 [Mycobacterium lentiflavum]CQD18624.1 hypothetical protein BN1232_04286 [Mycobacterium lentiflavum]